MSTGTWKSNRLVKYVGTGLGIATILFIAISFIATKIVYDKQFPRYDRPDENTTAHLRYSDIATDYPRIPVSFESEGNVLRGHIYGS
ncbi:MAG TPA: hypothetical protein DHV69_08995, partial [Sphaerochaeta sp.]|nr:hypothetical protein [Sphaerochaeta sp.]